MRIAVTILAIIIGNHCCAQALYNAKLTLKLEEIRKSDSFDNGVVMFDDDSNYGSDFPRWDAASDYYQDDIVTFKGGTIYRAVVERSGKSGIRKRFGSGPGPGLLRQN